MSRRVRFNRLIEESRFEDQLSAKQIGRTIALLDPPIERTIERYYPVNFNQPQYIFDREVVFHKFHQTENLLRLNIVVKNHRFEKHVVVRLTTDHWKRYIDIHANFSLSIDREHDLFTAVYFLFRRPASIEFAIRYRSGGHEWWDNHGGANYRFVREERKYPKEKYQVGGKPKKLLAQ